MAAMSLWRRLFRCVFACIEHGITFGPACVAVEAAGRAFHFFVTPHAPLMVSPLEAEGVVMVTAGVIGLFLQCFGGERVFLVTGAACHLFCRVAGLVTTNAVRVADQGAGGVVMAYRAVHDVSYVTGMVEVHLAV